MRIRLAGPEDLDLIARMRLAFLADVRDISPTDFQPDFVDATRSFVRDTFGDGTLHTWIAETPESFLGIVSVVLSRVPPRPHTTGPFEGYIINMYVLPTARSAGVGLALLDTCLAAAPGLGIGRFFLHATDAGRPLYEANGFTIDRDWLQLRVPSSSSRTGAVD